MSQILNSKIEETIQSLIKTAELIAEYGDQEMRDSDFFGQMLKTLITAKKNAKYAEKAAEVAKEKQTIAEFDAMYTQAWEKQTKCKPTGTTEYKQFMEEIGTILSINIDSVASTSVVEGDDFQMEIEISDIDPLTKRPMTHPIKNSVCGHHYEKSTILESIQVNPKLRCPVAGCGNNQFVKKAHLVEDPVFRMKLQRRNEATN